MIRIPAILPLVALVALLLPPGAAPAAGACAEPVFVPALGEACPAEGGYVVHVAGLPPLFTHGPHPARTPAVDGWTCLDGLGGSDYVPSRGACPSPVDPTCVTASDPVQRIEVLYVRPPGAPDRLAQMTPTLRELVRTANGAVHAEGRTEGANVTLRVACDPSGLIRVAGATSGNNAFGPLVADLAAQGHASSYAKYLVWYDGPSPDPAASGLAAGQKDDRLSPDNLNNRTAGYAVSYGSTSWHVLLHELTHALGAVQNSAPHSTKRGHCLDGQDVMCYQDFRPGGQIDPVRLVPTLAFSPAACTDREWYDCNHDDYFHPSPPAGSYLATHWNLGSPLNGFIQHGP